MKRQKTRQVGTVWTASAKLYSNGVLVGRCIDTPNAIARALMELPQAEMVKSLSGYRARSDYEDRMGDWNIAKSGLSKMETKT